ncbi:unnamed protein product [Schistosoma mattheei]|uniref:Uncharacterized protein n=1 Tax=Schistosoma mattheei TaxID=31246 RepID=A0A183NMM7_9TREM|nr:unnamed protein product [Schistosoma mattheei]
MQSSSPKEERKTKEHITPQNGIRHEKNEQELDGTRKEGPGQSGLENRHEKNEQELDGTRKEGPGQSGLENAGQRPMLLHCSNRRKESK